MASEDMGRAVQASKGFYLEQKEIKGIENPPQPRTSRVEHCACRESQAVEVTSPAQQTVTLTLRALTSIPQPTAYPSRLIFFSRSG